MRYTRQEVPRVAIVTGGSRGIGRACAQRLADVGVTVIVGYNSRSVEAASVVEAIETNGGRAAPIRVDIGDPAGVVTLFDTVEATYGAIDVVVNAAGNMVLSTLADFDMVALEDMFRTNVLGTFHVSQQAARRIQPGGSLINFSSSVVGRPLPSYAGYAATKGAVEAMTFILAQELRGRDVTVNTVAPGPTATAMFLEGKTEEQITFFANASPLERLATPDDIAAVVAFLTSSAGHWVNGQVLRANGGLH